MSAASSRARAERRRGDLPDHVGDRGGVARRLVLEHVGGVVRVTEERGALGAQLHQLRDDLAVLSVAPPRPRLMEAR